MTKNLMMIEELALYRGNPCITISFNTNRTHPDNLQDAIMMKNLIKEAETRLLASYDKREVLLIIEKLIEVAEKNDINYNLDSMHVFASADLIHVEKVAANVPQNQVYIGHRFSIRTLLQAVAHTMDYLLLVISQGGCKLYTATNNSIINEITTEGFPIDENAHIVADSEKRSDPKLLDNMVREYLNKVDKALVQVHNHTKLNCFVVATEDNYSRLLQVADKPNIYYGYASIDYNQKGTFALGNLAWSKMENQLKLNVQAALSEVSDAVSKSLVLTDLQEIYRAAIDGRADLLVIHEKYIKPVLFVDERNFDLLDDAQDTGSVEDVVGLIAWEVISRKGKVIFAQSEQMADLYPIALKLRY
jgi:hypothetical protein